MRRPARASEERRLPVGAEVMAGGVHFRVWAPKRSKVEVVLEGAGSASSELSPEDGGYFSGLISSIGAGKLYRFRLDGGFELFPDPASRFQPSGPHGPSEVVDSRAFAWTDGSWKGVSPAGQVLYEMHVGTFTREGTWAAAARELPELAKLGVTVIEVMPIADFSGRFGWGYDGVDWFAPTRLYGRPEDLRRFVDRAHAAGIGVILDVVYNHFGPDGSYVTQFADEYCSKTHETDWGAALNFDGEGAGAVRELVTGNARYWIDEFHFDGLRLDATQSIFDDSPTHILADVSAAVRAAGRGRSTFLVAENEPQHAKLARPRERGGYGLDALWNDDFHHSAIVALTGRREAYYTDYAGSAQELLSAVKYGYLFQGQRYAWQKQRRGTPALDLSPQAFVFFLENHDQVANSGRGKRLAASTSPARLRAATALLLLLPGTPMLFQGQEFASSAPFLYFADHGGELGRRVFEGRNEFLRQFPSLALPEMQAELTDPSRATTFEACKLDFSERVSHRGWYALHADLLRMRRNDPVFRAGARVDGFCFDERAFALRFFGEEGNDRLLVVNLGAQLDLAAVSDPLFAPPGGTTWQIRWSSNDAAYGGEGTPPIERDDGVSIPAECAVLLSPS